MKAVSSRGPVPPGLADASIPPWKLFALRETQFKLSVQAIPESFGTHIKKFNDVLLVVLLGKPLGKYFFDSCLLAVASPVRTADLNNVSYVEWHLFGYSVRAY